MSEERQHDAPAVTIIRPVKGLEPELYDCLASTFRQRYPRDRFSIRLCVDSRDDPSYPVLRKLVADFPDVDAEVMVETDDKLLGKGKPTDIGPNPKVRNISRAYREAKGNLIWIIDCNVWVGPGVMGRMVDKLLGLKRGGGASVPFKFVHHLPIAVDIADYARSSGSESRRLMAADRDVAARSGLWAEILAQGGGRLDEMFMATTHAKFYGAINAVGIAPCVVGKSNMFRKSQLDFATDPAQNPILPRNQDKPNGVDLFSYNICEDHLIGDILWRTAFPGHNNHGTVWGDIPVQPLAGMSVAAYAGRRVRWLRARKWTVLAATLVEPGVESLLCCAYFSFAMTTLPWFNMKLGIPMTWHAMAIVWLACVTIWMLADRLTYRRLHAGLAIEVDSATPRFAQGTRSTGGMPVRAFHVWLFAWLGREILALPIWTWAVLLGRTVKWRGNYYLVRSDMSVEELNDSRHGGRAGADAPLPNGSKHHLKERLA